MEQLNQNFNDGGVMQGIFLDLSKAFDTNNHEILADKLPFYNFSSDACVFFQSYLSNRKQFVKINDHNSALREVKIWGAPRVSSWFNFVFNLYK